MLLASGGSSILGNNLAVIIAFITLLGTAAVVVAGSFKTTRDKTTLVNLQASAESWERKSKAQEDEIKELQRHLAEKDEQLKELTGRVSVLQDMVTGKSLIESLSRHVEELALSNQAKLNNLYGLVEEVRIAVIDSSRENGKAGS